MKIKGYHISKRKAGVGDTWHEYRVYKPNEFGIYKFYYLKDALTWINYWETAK